MAEHYVLVTGATGFIGAHVVDELLRRGIRVRGTTRSLAKGEVMRAARSQYKDLLDFVEVKDFEHSGSFEEAVKGVNSIIHIASPFRYDITDNEKQLVLPAIHGVQAILTAAATQPQIKRIVITSSFAAIFDTGRTFSTYGSYTAADWNSMTYEEAISPTSAAVVAYRGSKTFAEKSAWTFVKEKKPVFDLVTICPPMVFGPVVHPITKPDELNQSNLFIWQVARGDETLPPARVPFWVDVRDLAFAHVEALLRPEASGKRFVVCSPKRFSYEQAANIIIDNYPSLAAKVTREKQTVDESYGLDGETAGRELGVTYRPFDVSVKDLVSQVTQWE